jgi:CHASE2 domain-containing sensor protein
MRKPKFINFLSWKEIILGLAWIATGLFLTVWLRQPYIAAFLMLLGFYFIVTGSKEKSKQ